MKRERRQYSGAFKARVGLEALMGLKTTVQGAREHGVHPLLSGHRDRGWTAEKASEP